MQCTHPSWVSTLHSPGIKISTSTAKFLPQKRRQDQRCFRGGGGDDDSAALPLPSHVNSITSTANPFVKHCLKLRHSSSYRHSNGSVLVVGSTPIREIFRFQESVAKRTARMDCLLVLDEAEIPEGLDSLPVRIVRVSSTVMKKLSGLQSVESIEAIALMRFPASYCNLEAAQKDLDCQRWFLHTHRVLVLDGIQDPGNLGTLLRSAMAFRWGGVFLLPGCCDPFNEKALRASRGASFQLPLVSGNWVHLEALKREFKMEMLAGHPEGNEALKPVASLTQKLADSLSDVPLCLVLGSEGRGLSDKTLQASELVGIPMPGKFESLNVSVAGGIFLHMLQPENQPSL